MASLVRVGEEMGGGVRQPDEEDEVRETMRDLFIVIVLLIENCLEAAT